MNGFNESQRPVLAKEEGCSLRLSFQLEQAHKFLISNTTSFSPKIRCRNWGFHGSRVRAFLSVRPIEIIHEPRALCNGRDVVQFRTQVDVNFEGFHRDTNIYLTWLENIRSMVKVTDIWNRKKWLDCSWPWDLLRYSTRMTAKRITAFNPRASFIIIAPLSSGVEKAVMDITVDIYYNISFAAVHSPLSSGLLTIATLKASLVESLKLLYTTGKLSDFTLVASDGKEFNVHRMILQMRSPIWDAMLSHETKERSQGRCVISDVDGETLDAVLKFCYTGEVSTFCHNVEKVLVAADKYDITELRRFCEEYLQDEITPANLETLADLANTRSLLIMKTAVEEIRNFKPITWPQVRALDVD